MQNNNLRLPGSKPAGFTLIELVIVVAVSAILAGIAATKQSEHKIRQTLSNKSLAVTRSYREARQVAISRGQAISILAEQERIEVFRWTDSDGDRTVDWTDTNANGVFDSGEGEVAEAFDVIQIDNPELFGTRYAGDYELKTQKQGQSVGGCNGGGVTQGDDRLAIFLPSGLLLAADSRPCSMRLYLESQSDTDLYSVIAVSPSGLVEAYDAF